MIILNNADNIYVGATEADKIYLGGTEIWSSGPFVAFSGVTTSSTDWTTYLPGRPTAHIVKDNGDGTYNFEIYSPTAVTESDLEDCFSGDEDLITIAAVNVSYDIGNVPEYVFDGCTNLIDFNFLFPSDNTVGDSAFSCCENLREEKISQFVSYSTTIGKQSFENCKQLTKLEIYNATSIGENAFNGCDNLTRIDIEKSAPPSITTTTFNNTGNCNIHIPEGSYSTYVNTTNWQLYSLRLVDDL